jgi:hypothetical protein
METTSSYRSAGASARSLRWQRGLGIALLAAGLSGAPLLARAASAQRPAAIQASAYVVDSYIATGLRPDSATGARPTATARAPMMHPSRQIRIIGVGVLDVRSGFDTDIRVASRVADARGALGSTIQVSVTYLGN